MPSARTARRPRAPLLAAALSGAAPLLAAALLAAAALPARAGDVPFTPTSSLWREAFGTVPADLHAFVTAPVDHPRAVGTAVAVVGALVLFDKPITTFYQHSVEKAFSHFALPQAPVSWPQAGIVSEDVWLLSGIAGSYAYGALAHDDRAARAGLLSAKAVAYSYFVSELALKTIFARKRPYPDLSNPKGDPAQYTTDPYDFFNWPGSFLSFGRSGRSMPSYHFTEYFSVARVFSGIYDNSPWPYAGALVLAASRIKGHHHWVSDMVAGSLVGYGIGSVLLDNSQKWQAGHLTATPVVGPGTAGVQLGMKF